jgi:hypothetical protein
MMKRPKIVNTVIAGAFVITLRSSFLAAQQPPPQQEQPSQKGEMKSMGMGGMMKECSEHHEAMTKSIDQMTKTLDGAKQSNDSGKMRAAIDQALTQLGEMKDHMAMCGKMMNMMQKMQGGMMKENSK